ncbi:bis(5'-nucleosyl)-tetraphosphatase PrpE [Bacillus inaquosorum]|uniref:bis(5'-nucleosyl)-tetraphosphatase PrpE n=1 Tax=Bacillus inaquosorum TaxID=483913 RepID=UPI002280C136|nr:bis(5'-nucleosyl)-tetraphosphatase PrpE [Bacillus inaquosorum]MCY9072517.1 bis(5'-nucleosyl)-tetraphosphatase PrpE [Bacillus inaquosorum]MCY9077600.1 bis(5'-nucleosyl)-tetraphosphatase PrpE [Bacillus inaquosorum]MCY9176899.1 bis(5'-nucleosyl)-tetraphosphatase PrpE [Bacillus inaquosorum]
MAYDIISDIHGCYDEMTELIQKLGYTIKNGVPVHEEGRVLVFAGDLTDRGPKSIEVIRFVAGAYEKGAVRYVPGNHCNKLYRYLKGNPVKVMHGLETTAAELEETSNEERKAVSEQFMKLYETAPLYDILHNGELVVAHAGIKADDIGKNTRRVKDFVLYGDVTGETYPDGRPVRRDWAASYNGKAWVVYGHTPVKEPRKINRTINIDTGCVFGNKLTGFRFPEIETVSVPSSLPYDESRFRTI